jgi:hypothetical protein
VGVIAAVKRAFGRDPLTGSFAPQTKLDINTCRARIADTDKSIDATEAELGQQVLDSVLGGDDRAEELATNLHKLRTRKSVLLHALARAEQLEADRVTAAREREAASRRRAAVQHLARLEKHFAELVEHVAQAQAAFTKAAEARQAAALLLPHRGSGGYAPVHDDLSYHRLRNLARLAACREGAGSLYPLIEHKDVVGAGAYEDSQGAPRPMQDVLAEIVAQAKQALNPQQTEPAPTIGGLSVPEGATGEQNPCVTPGPSEPVAPTRDDTATSEPAAERADNA